jgi:hypothetical protein
MATVLEKLQEKVANFVNDVTTLEVTTVSGSIGVDVILSADKTKIDFNKIWDQMGAAAGGAGKLTLVATTKVDFDKDVKQYIKDNLIDSDKELVALHNAAVKSSAEARKAAVESLVSIAKELFPGKIL